jgi:zinc protease
MVEKEVVGFEFKGSDHGFESYVLKRNGLQVLYRYDDTAPVAGVMVTYLVGSKHEAVGFTGATHLLEHLMFKGSKKFPPKNGVSQLDRLSETGALVNATTWLDRTNYYEVFPAEHLELVLELEADRMRHAIITEKDRAMEMPAVRSEFAMRVDNVPEEYLDEKIWATAFMAHPYHHPTIGWQDDFEKVSIERLRHFYDTYYWPNNAYLSIISNVKPKDALALVRKHFGVHPHSPHPIPEPYTREPEQQGVRTVEVCRTGTKNLLGIAYKVPEALHADTPALLALASILADGETSRLHRALVEKGLCVSVESHYGLHKDPSLLPMYATLTGNDTHEKVLSICEKEIVRLQNEGVTPQELQGVLAHLETEMAFARDGHYATLSVLNEAIAVGDWRFLFTLPHRIQKVTAEDVVRVARTYLTRSKMTTGMYRATTTH